MKTAILVVSFGSTVETARTQNIAPVVEAIRAANPDCTIREAFTSRIVRKRLLDRGITVPSETEALEALVAEGYQRIIVQSLHLVGGEEFNKLRQAIRTVTGDRDVHVTLGRPLLFFTGQEGEYPDDFDILLEVLREEIGAPATEGVVLVGHGGVSPENTAYAALQLKALQKGYTNMRMVTLESYPTLEDTVVPWQLGPAPERIHVYPLLLVAGDHVLNDIMGDEDDAVVKQIEASGIPATGYPIGLGARPGVQQLFVQHVADARAERYGYKNFFTNRA